MERKEDRRVTMTKRMMKDAFTEMLKETDIYHISVRELCQRADVNRTTFYKYYANQFDLLDDMEKDLLNMIEKTIEEDEEKNGGTIEKLLVFFERERAFIRLLINSNVDTEFPKKLFSMTIVESSIEMMTANVPKAEAEYINRFVLFGLFEMLRCWINKEERESPKEMAKILLERLMLNFGSGPKGKGI